MNQVKEVTMHADALPPSHLLGLLTAIEELRGRVQATNTLLFNLRPLSVGNRNWLHTHQDNHHVLDIAKIDPAMLNNALLLLCESAEMLHRITSVAIGERKEIDPFDWQLHLDAAQQYLAAMGEPAEPAQARWPELFDGLDGQMTASEEMSVGGEEEPASYRVLTVGAAAVDREE